MTDETLNNGQSKNELATMIDVLDDLTVLQKRFLHSRWLDRVSWMEEKASSSQRRYFALRLTAIIGAVIVPALLGLKFSGNFFPAPVFWLTFLASLLVAVSVAVEELFHYGESWRHYRRILELLKSEGWQFFQLAGTYRDYRNHGEAYQDFAAKVEDLSRQAIDTFITQTSKEKLESLRDSGARGFSVE